MNSQPQLQIRPARLEDAGPLAGLLKAIGWFSSLQNKSLQDIEAQVRENLAACLGSDEHSIYLACSGEGELLGYVSVHWLAYLFLPGPEGYVSELFVADSARGQGIGAALLQQVQRDAAERGCYRLSLLNNRQRESYRRGFYTKQGWEEREAMANFVYWMDRKYPS